MVNGFEKETSELTPEEFEMIVPMLKGLRTKIGKEKAITNDQMIIGLKKLGFNTTPPRMRKIIHHIRVTRMVGRLVATSSGYYIEPDDKKLAVYVESLDQRIRSIQEIRDSYGISQSEKL